MAGNESFEALRVENSKSHEVVVEEEEEEEYEEDPEEAEVEESEEEEDEEDEPEGEPLGELELSELQSSAPLGEPKLGDSQFETLAPSSSSLQSSLNDHCAVLAVNSTSQSLGGAEVQDQVGVSPQEALASATAQLVDAQTQNQYQVAVCPTSPSELSPTSVTQSISSLPSPTLLERRLSPVKVNDECTPKSDLQVSSDLKPMSSVPVVKTPSSDGYNWRKYGQKQVKSPKGSRSYYKCTFSDCSAKKIECSDHSGRVIEIVYKSQHSHDPPRKFNCTKENKLASSTELVVANSVTEHPIQMLNKSEPPTASKETIKETPLISERKRQNSSDSNGNCETKIKEEHVNEPEPKRRVKKSNLANSGSIIKPGKKPKFVVHAAGDVGISGDGYRWRKYGQKMVKGNPHPRNYYRCTSAGCPVRKHIETAVDNASAVIITYKGVHDHDMPVPKKRHGPPSAPLVAAAAPASMNNLQSKKTDALQNQASSTQWSVDTEGELTGEAMELGGEKAIESARTLLSIGFEIKPC
ncbi:probable WRKY transcription factor 32 [Quercus lobata]|nr:probable WRKY transcription factor 32 [Quercus lobata]